MGEVGEPEAVEAVGATGGKQACPDVMGLSEIVRTPEVEVEEYLKSSVTQSDEGSQNEPG